MEWNASRNVIDGASAQTRKFAATASGDVIDFIDRPNGGIVLSIIDGQGSGPAARRISSVLSHMASGLLSDGVREDVTLLALHDHLLSLRGGQVSATVDLVSVDPARNLIVCARNANTPLIVWSSGDLTVHPPTSTPIGQPVTRPPDLLKIPLRDDTVIIAMSDGAAGAGTRYGDTPDLISAVAHLERPASDIANDLLEQSIARDRGTPADDMTVGVVAIRTKQQRLTINRRSAFVSLGAPS